MSSKSELGCQLLIEGVTFVDEITAFYYEEQCESHPGLSSHMVEFNDHSRITIHSWQDRIEFWHAENVDIQCRGQKLIVRPLSAVST